MLLALKRNISDPSPEVREKSMQYARLLFDHQTPPVYQSALEAVRWSSGLTDRRHVRSELRDGLDTSSTSIVRNIAEGNGKYSRRDRCRFLEIAHRSTLRCAAVLDVWVATGQRNEDESSGDKNCCQVLLPRSSDGSAPCNGERGGKYDRK